MIATRQVPVAFALTDSPHHPNPPPQPRHETRVKIPRVPSSKWHDPIVYHELKQIGEGAIGSVSLVMDLQTGRKMAVKIIPVKEGKEKDPKELAKSEVEFLANCDHVSLSFLSCLGYLFTVMNRHISLTLCIRKVGKWESRLRYSCPLPTVLCESILAISWRKQRSF